ncbi:MAG: DHA2 family efflux MFS transporter permease subunit [Steroidobacteraceae bacterium]
MSSTGQQIRPPGEFPPLKGAELVLLTIAVAMATFMEVLDMTIVNVSIPAIAGSLGVSPSEGTWTVSSYSLAAAIMQPLTGWIGRRFGEVRSFVTSMFLFVVFSAICGLATSMNMLIVARLIQGLVSGPMIAIAQALLLRNYPPEKRGMALGLWGMVIIVAPIFGPILGGWITDNFSWPWIFYINLPIGVLAMFVTWNILKDRESQKVIVPIDAVGLTLLVVGVGCLQYMLDNGNEKDWFASPLITSVGAIALVCLTYLIVWELSDKHPILDLHFFQRRNFLIGAIATSLGYFTFFGVNVVFPLWLQTTLGYTSTWAGLAMAPIGIFAIIMAPIVGKNMHRMNLRVAASVAFIIFSICMFWVSTLTNQASFSQLATPRLWQGIGIAMFFLPLNQVLMSNIKPHELASASGLSNFLRTIAGSISTAVSIWLWNDREDFHRAVLVEHIRPDSPGWNQTQQTLINLGLPDTQTYGYVESVIKQQAATLAVNDLYMLFGVVFALLIPIVWFARPPFQSATGGSLH